MKFRLEAGGSALRSKVESGCVSSGRSSKSLRLCSSYLVRSDSSRKSGGCTETASVDTAQLRGRRNRFVRLLLGGRRASANITEVQQKVKEEPQYFIQSLF